MALSDHNVRWVRTTELAAILGVHRNTLGRMIRSGHLRDGRHRTRINPASPRGEFVWNVDAVLQALNRL